MYLDQRIAVVIPCYKVAAHIRDVLKAMPDFVDDVICVDDACPQGTAALVETECIDPRVRVLRNPRNLGVGGAVINGMRAARSAGADIIVKIDGDGQMNPTLMHAFVEPIASGVTDYAKGNRFFRIEDVRRMPRIRLIGVSVV